MRRARMEVVALIGVLLRQADDIEQVLPNLFRVRRGLPLFAPALPRWASGAVNVYRPDWDGVSAWSVARVASLPFLFQDGPSSRAARASVEISTASTSTFSTR